MTRVGKHIDRYVHTLNNFDTTRSMSHVKVNPIYWEVLCESI